MYVYLKLFKYDDLKLFKYDDLKLFKYDDLKLFKYDDLKLFQSDDLKLFKYDDLKIKISILLCINSLNMPWQEKQLKNRTVVSDVLFFVDHSVYPKWSDFRVYHITN